MIDAPPAAAAGSHRQRPGSRREALLDAAGGLLQTRAWSDIRMADVAQAAGVKRGILYKHFGSRPALERALNARERARLTDRVRRALSANRSSPVDALRVVSGMLSSGAPRPALGAAARASELSALILEAWPTLRPPDTDLLSDALIRLAASYERRPGAAGADSIAAILGAFLEQRLAHPHG